MPYYRLPTTQNTPWYEFSTVLNSQVWGFELRYNVRIGRWFMTIKDSAGNVILAGVPLLIERPLTTQYPTLNLPDGSMFVLDTTGARNQPGLGSFLTTHALYFYTP